MNKKKNKLEYKLEYKERRREKSAGRRGQVVLALAMSFVIVSASVVVGISVSSARELRSAGIFLNSVQSYYAAESGVEDAVYRLKKVKQLSGTEMISLSGTTAASAETVITDMAGGKKEILAKGISGNAVRKILAIALITTNQISFHYGIQAGFDGIAMSQNSIIYGNVYSNGHIIGSGSNSNMSLITDTAFAANPQVAVIDQKNDSPMPPPNSVNIYNSGYGPLFAQSFKPATTGTLRKLSLYMKTGFSTLFSYGTVDIVPDAGGIPGEIPIASVSIASGALTSSYKWIDLSFSSGPELYAGQEYWFVLRPGAFSEFYIGANTAYADGIGKKSPYGTSWEDTSPVGLDGYFRVYKDETIDGLISNVKIGSSGEGDAHAHTVENSVINGALYCQDGTGNKNESGGSISCNTSEPDPEVQPVAVSDADIDDWKTQAEAGGVTTGDVTVSSNISLGPRKITGNLTVQGGKTLTLSGTLWVQGTITTLNNAIIRLDSGYGSGSGVIVADGKISLSNNVQFFGSGSAGSYILLISTSDCPASASCGGADAIEVLNNAGTVLLNAHNGTLHFHNNSGAKEATGKKIVLDNGATITYESGLANVNFTSGPGASYEVLEWREVE